MDYDMQRLERVERAVRGDVAALTALLADAHGGLCRYLSPKLPADLRSAIDVEDIVQEADLAAFRFIRTFEPRGPDSFDRWLATIALRRLRNAIKFHRRARRGGRSTPLVNANAPIDRSTVALLDLIEASDRTPSRVLARHEAFAEAAAALNELPSEYRDAVRLVYLEGRSVVEAARELGRTERAVHNLCFKAKQRLRDLLGDRDRFPSSVG